MIIWKVKWVTVRWFNSVQMEFVWTAITVATIEKTIVLLSDILPTFFFLNTFKNTKIQALSMRQDLTTTAAKLLDVCCHFILNGYFIWCNTYTYSHTLNILWATVNAFSFALSSSAAASAPPSALAQPQNRCPVRGHRAECSSCRPPPPWTWVCGPGQAAVPPWETAIGGDRSWTTALGWRREGGGRRTNKSRRTSRCRREKWQRASHRPDTPNTGPTTDLLTFSTKVINICIFSLFINKHYDDCNLYK